MINKHIINPLILQVMAEELRKGSIGNPYNLQEAQELFDKGLWQGGFVRIEPDIIKYFRSSESP